MIYINIYKYTHTQSWAGHELYSMAAAASWRGGICQVYGLVSAVGKIQIHSEWKTFSGHVFTAVCYSKGYKLNLRKLGEDEAARFDPDFL